jgi:hypothetical protein
MDRVVSQGHQGYLVVLSLAWAHRRLQPFQLRLPDPVDDFYLDREQTFVHRSDNGRILAAADSRSILRRGNCHVKLANKASRNAFAPVPGATLCHCPYEADRAELRYDIPYLLNVEKSSADESPFIHHPPKSLQCDQRLGPRSGLGSRRLDMRAEPGSR